jgi:hypothetical protein
MRARRGAGPRCLPQQGGVAICDLACAPDFRWIPPGLSWCSASMTVRHWLFLYRQEYGFHQQEIDLQPPVGPCGGGILRPPPFFLLDGGGVECPCRNQASWERCCAVPCCWDAPSRWIPRRLPLSVALLHSSVNLRGRTRFPAVSRSILTWRPMAAIRCITMAMHRIAIPLPGPWDTSRKSAVVMAAVSPAVVVRCIPSIAMGA